MDQISLFHAKLTHLEEALKIEEKEEQLKKKLEFRKNAAYRDADLAARKEQEKANEERELLHEEGIRKSLLNNMMTESDDTLGPIKKFLANFEGN